MRSVHVHVNGISPDLRVGLTASIRGAIAERRGDWETSITEDAENNAWDVEMHGPNHFHWSRRFSGADRDPSVISAAIDEANTAAKAA